MIIILGGGTYIVFTTVTNSNIVQFKFNISIAKYYILQYMHPIYSYLVIYILLTALYGHVLTNSRSD